MPPLLYDPPDLRHYTAGSDPPMSAWPGARDNARRPKPKATRKPRPRSWPSAIMTAETGAGPSAWRARRHRGQRPVLGALPDGPGERAPTPTGRSSCTPARMAARNYSGPRLAPNAAYRASRNPPRGRRTRNRPSTAPDALSGGAAGSFRGHGVSWARRGLVRRINPCNPDAMSPKHRTRVQPCVWGAGYAGVETGPCGLTMSRRGKTAHAALERAAARSRGGLNDPTARAEKGRSA